MNRFPMRRILTILTLIIGAGSLALALPEWIGVDHSERPETPAVDGPRLAKGAELVATASKTRREFVADIAVGRIGVPTSGRHDDPHDNVFVVDLDEKPSSDDVVWLSYELNGAPDHDAVPRSINDQRSVGGVLWRRSSGWTRQTERISPEILRAKGNVIRFGTYDPTTQHYSIRDLRIIVEKAASENDPSIVITNAGDSIYGGLAYVKGFVRDSEVRELRIDGRTIEIDNGAFEAAVDLTSHQASRAAIKITASTLDHELSEIVPVGPMTKAVLHFHEPSAPSMSTPFLPGSELRMACGEALLEMDGSASEVPHQQASFRGSATHAGGPCERDPEWRGL